MNGPVNLCKMSFPGQFPPVFEIDPDDDDDDDDDDDNDDDNSVIYPRQYL